MSAIPARRPAEAPVTHRSSVGPVGAEGPSGRLLLVEDDDGDAFLVSELLNLGEPGLQVTRVSTLAEALKHLDDPSRTTDVVVLDLGLPDADGLDIVPRVVAAAPGAAVLVLTGLRDEDRGVAAVAAGAQDYLVKGQVDDRSLHRAVTYAVGRKRVEETTRRMVEWELQKRQNARLERGLLPTPLVSAPDWTIRTGYRPGQHRSLLGGDFFDVVQLSDGRLHVVIGDVAGHGPDEAALGVLLRAAWRALVLARTPAQDLLPMLTLLLESERPDEEVFATALYLVVEPDGVSAELFNAGHPVPVSVPACPDGAWTLSAGPPLGIVDGFAWPAQRLETPGSFPLLLYTDGLVEGRAHPSTPGDRLGEERLLDIVRAERDGDAGTLIDRLIRRAEEAHGDALPDDVALLLLEPGPGDGAR